MCFDRFVTGYQKLNHFRKSPNRKLVESDFMIHAHSDVAKLSYDTLSVGVRAESVFGKNKKSRKKNRWRPYHVVPTRVFCSSSKTDSAPYTSKKRLRSSSGCHERMPDTGIIHLPDELVVKVLSNLDINDVSVCRRVNHRWHALVDKRHLQACAFARFLHYQPTPKPQTVENYRLSTRSWLRGFGIRGKELSEQLDELLEHKHFPEILFFAIAEVLAKTRVLTCQHVCTFEHSDSVTDASFSPDGRHLVTASTDDTAQIWELVAGQWRKKVTIQDSGWVLTARFSPDGHYLLTAGRTAQIWELVGGHWQQKTTIEHSGLMNANFSPDGHHLVIASVINIAQIWELVAGQWQQKITIQHSDFVINASFSPDGRHLVTASGDCTGQIWELVAGQWRKKATIEHLGMVNSANFSLDGHYFATASNDHTVQIWEFVVGQWRQKTTIQHSGIVRNASFSPDGRHLSTASGDRTVIIWELVAGRWQEKATIEHSMPVNHVSFSPDGCHLVIASEDQTVKILGRFAGQWQEKATISHTSDVQRARFSPDGSLLLTASSNNTAKVWLLKSRVNNDIP